MHDSFCVYVCAHNALQVWFTGFQVRERKRLKENHFKVLNGIIITIISIIIYCRFILQAYAEI